jgi:hypothetical protein
VAKKTLAQQEDMASKYGWALAVLRSNPELSKLFDNAVNGSYTSQKFVAELRNTNWYKTRGETARQNEVLKGADPAEYKRRMSQMSASVADSYTAMTGQAPNAKLLASMTNLAFMGGYSDAEIRDLVGKSFSTAQQMKNGLGGTLGEAERQIRTAIEDYGLDMGESWISRQLNYVATGRTDATATANYLQKQAMSKYGAYKDELEQGMTMRDIAEPFRQLMAKTLELSDKSLSLSDPSMQKALLYREPAKGGKPGAPAAMPLWQFESQLKNDPRWTGTQNAQDTIMAAGRKVLADWGLTTGSAA